MVKNIVNQQLQGADDFVGDELLLTEDDYEVGSAIGFTERMLERADEDQFLLDSPPMYTESNPSSTKIILKQYKPVEELKGKNDKRSLVEFLEDLYNFNPEYNEEYYSYELDRLGEI